MLVPMLVRTSSLRAPRIVLLVSDRVHVLGACVPVLDGARVFGIAAETAASAVSAARTIAVDLVAVDARLPGASVERVAREVRPHAPNALLVLLGSGPREGFDRAVAAELDPATLRELLAAELGPVREDPLPTEPVPTEPVPTEPATDRAVPDQGVRRRPVRDQSARETFAPRREISAAIPASLWRR